MTNRTKSVGSKSEPNNQARLYAMTTTLTQRPVKYTAMYCYLYTCLNEIILRKDRIWQFLSSLVWDHTTKLCKTQSALLCDSSASYRSSTPGSWSADNKDVNNLPKTVHHTTVQNWWLNVQWLNCKSNALVLHHYATQLYSLTTWPECRQ